MKPVALEPVSAPTARRVAGVDAARGLAAFIMIQGHGYDAYVADSERATAAFAVTRFLGTFPLPAFLVLAGASVALRLHRFSGTRAHGRLLRARIIRRGLSLVAAGYLLQGIFAWIDGWDGLATLLRADVLQCIGLSIALVGGSWCPSHGGDGQSAYRRWLRRCVTLGVALAIICPWWSGLGPLVGVPWSYLAAPFVDVPGVTRMPVIPLAGWTAGGAAVCGTLLAWGSGSKDANDQVRGAPFFLVLALLFAAALLSLATAPVAQAFAPPGGLTRTHPSVWANIADLFGRGVVIFAIGSLLAGAVPTAVRWVVCTMGRGSLWAYVFHLPFCYGFFGSRLTHQLTMFEATAAIAALMLLSFGAVVATDAVKTQLRKRAGTARTQPIGAGRSMGDAP